MTEFTLKVCLVFCLVSFVAGKIFYYPYPRRFVSEDRERQLRVLAREFTNTSVNPEKYPCVSYYEYACSRRKPLFSPLGSEPRLRDIITMMNALHNEVKLFEAKTKMLHFFTSCHKVKSVDECYKETFTHFKPLFAYIVTQKFMNAEDKDTFMNVTETFLSYHEHNDSKRLLKTRWHSVLSSLLNGARDVYGIEDLNSEYALVYIYPESYEYNLKNLKKLETSNLTYYGGPARKLVDITLYMFQSRNQPRSYYYASLNVHLWMTLYNISYIDNPQKYKSLADCFHLPHYINVLEEARKLSVLYYKAYNSAWEEYMTWIGNKIHQQIYDEENEILHEYYIDNKHVFFTVYAQTFCEFGKEIAEHVFYQGMMHNYDFLNLNSCEAEMPMNPKYRCEL